MPRRVDLRGKRAVEQGGQRGPWKLNLAVVLAAYRGALIVAGRGNGQKPK